MRQFDVDAERLAIADGLGVMQQAHQLSLAALPGSTELATFTPSARERPRGPRARTRRQREGRPQHGQRRVLGSIGNGADKDVEATTIGFHLRKQHRLADLVLQLVTRPCRVPHHGTPLLPSFSRRRRFHERRRQPNSSALLHGIREGEAVPLPRRARRISDGRRVHAVAMVHHPVLLARTAVDALPHCSADLAVPRHVLCGFPLHAVRHLAPSHRPREEMPR
mmetsp:Transcript_127866/g.370046  ORF Transcript_127866/g.370046 Transcript_127866/m.370046 type:complete len:223 (+) Transcript_127866:509-1177(+)